MKSNKHKGGKGTTYAAPTTSYTKSAINNKIQEETPGSDVNNIFYGNEIKDINLVSYIPNNNIYDMEFNSNMLKKSGQTFDTFDTMKY